MCCTAHNWTLHRAELKVTDLRWRSPICGFLRKSAVSSENLRFSAVSCALQMLEFPGEGVNQRKSAFWDFSVTLVPSPSARPDFKRDCFFKTRALNAQSTMEDVVLELPTELWTVGPLEDAKAILHALLIPSSVPASIGIPLNAWSGFGGAMQAEVHKDLPLINFSGGFLGASDSVRSACSLGIPTENL